MVGTGKVSSILSTATPGRHSIKTKRSVDNSYSLEVLFFRRRVFFHVDTSMYKSDQIFLSDSFYVIKYLLALK